MPHSSNNQCHRSSNAQTQLRLASSRLYPKDCPVHLPVGLVVTGCHILQHNVVAAMKHQLLNQGLSILSLLPTFQLFKPAKPPGHAEIAAPDQQPVLTRAKSRTDRLHMTLPPKPCLDHRKCNKTPHICAPPPSQLSHFHS